jgi:uncharacterized membrane protein
VTFSAVIASRRRSNPGAEDAAPGLLRRYAPRNDEGRRRLNSASCLAAALFWIGLLAAPAYAEYRVCNKSKVLLNVAVGYDTGEHFVTQGWWSVTPGSCATPIRGALTSRFVYVYATDIDGADVLKGATSMCVNRQKFEAVGIGDCWRRGLQAVNFAEVDTVSSPVWTTYLGDPAQ